MSQLTMKERGGSRDSLLLVAGMRLSDQGETLRIKVRNLSKGGMMAECPVHVDCGEQLMIDLRNVGWISGRVAWVVENRFGVTFDREIDCKAVRLPVSVGDNDSTKTMRRIPGAAGGLPTHPGPGNLRRI